MEKRVERIINLLLLLWLLDRKDQQYLELQQEMLLLENDAVAELQGSGVSYFRQYYRTVFTASVLTVARSLMFGQLPPGMQTTGSRTEDAVRLRSFLSRSLVTVSSRTGGVFRYDPLYYLKLVAHTAAGEARKNAVLQEVSQQGIEYVRISPNPSTIGDYCDHYRGRVFSVSGQSQDFPPLSVCPNGGPPFHPWCHHYLIPIEDPKKYIGQDPLTSQWIDLAQRGASPAEYQKVWKSSRS